MIRPLRRDDREVLRSIVAGTGMFSDDEVGIAVELMDVVLDRHGQKDYVIRVAEEEGRVAGYYCIGPTPATEGTFDLYWIVVDARAQGRGTGRMLEEHASALTKELGGRLLVAETSSQPKYESTRAFYRRRGYSEVARIREYYRPGDDLVVYAKYLAVS
jgi:ribosomal protein S18 acetylase RimI-like enzyme